MIGRNIHYDWLTNLREKTFDRWAHNAMVAHDIDADHVVNGIPTYSWEAVKYSWGEDARRKAKAKKERPLVWFALVKFPDLIESLITLPHSLCSTISYFFYYQKERFDRIPLGISRFGWYDSDYRLERAAIVLLIDYVDEECGGLFGPYHGLGHQAECEEYSEERRQHYRDLIAAYNYFKTEDAKLNKEIDDLYANNPENSETQDKFEVLETNIKGLREKHLNAIWQNRKYLWT